MATIQTIKQALIEYNYRIVFANKTMGSRSMQQDIADEIWNEKLAPFIKNETITTWEKDIQEKMLNPYCKWAISEKQAYCLARAFQSINQDTISIN
jgi:hypothetical protein